MAVLAYTQPGDGVLIQPPVYHPFFRAVTDHERKLIYNPLVRSADTYTIDFDDFRKKAAAASLFILCHPHNPVGRVWSREELAEMLSICRENNVVIVSDEIHSDLMLGDSKHIPLLSLEGADESCAACYSPSKTFNLAGLSTSYMIIPNAELRKKFERIPDNLHVHLGNIFGNTALEAAYNRGDLWLEALLEYLTGNYRFLKKFITEKVPEISVVNCGATYLVWLDFSRFGMNDQELKKFINHEAKLGLNDGPGFGPGGSGFQRINIALPRQKLEEALGLLERAVAGRR
jgi:cystathionine beta-lyase